MQSHALPSFVDFPRSRPDLRDMGYSKEKEKTKLRQDRHRRELALGAKEDGRTREKLGPAPSRRWRPLRSPISR